MLNLIPQKKTRRMCTNCQESLEEAVEEQIPHHLSLLYRWNYPYQEITQHSWYGGHQNPAERKQSSSSNCKACCRCWALGEELGMHRSVKNWCKNPTQHLCSCEVWGWIWSQCVWIHLYEVKWGNERELHLYEVYWSFPCGSKKEPLLRRVSLDV